MELAAIHPNALKHGLTEEDIRHAWSNAFEWIRRDRDDGIIDYVFIGPDTKGNLSELIARFSAPVGGYIVSFNIWYTLFVLFAILPSVITVLYKGKLWKKFYKQMGVLKREEETYSVAICGLNSAKENKINGASDVLLKKWSQTRLRANDLENLQSAKIFIFA